MSSDSFELVEPALPEGEKKTRKKSMPKPQQNKNAELGVEILSYRHLDRRVNNPEVGMVTPFTDPDAGKTRWKYDPHIDPSLQFDSQRAWTENLIDDALASNDLEQMKQALEALKKAQSPYLNWAGKAEHTSFEIDTVSLHVHERVDPASILAAVRRRMGKDEVSKGKIRALQPGLFDAPFENLPLRDALDFYKHEKGWSNRLIAGDSLLVMNSLLQKESMAGKVQMVYFDPPYGIKYGSNFQPFVNKKDVKDKSDNDLTQEPEMLKAFRDTWELGIHSYLTYMRDRLLLAKDLLNDTGSIFVQISDENIHHLREILDDVFGIENFIIQIAYATTSGFETNSLSRAGDYIVWYAKDKKKMKFKNLYKEKIFGGEGSSAYKNIKIDKDEPISIAQWEKISKTKFDYKTNTFPIFAIGDLTSQNPAKEDQTFEVHGIKFKPGVSNHWKANYPIGMNRLLKANRIGKTKSSIGYIRYFNDFPVQPLNNFWFDTLGQNQLGGSKVYVVQTALTVIQRCLLMTTDPGDLVLDPTCGSGSTAVVAEKWGRRWITCDTSRIAITLAKQRLMTSSFDYYELKYSNEGLKGGFFYETVPHITLKSIANNPDIDQIYDRLHPKIEEALTQLNKELIAQPPASFKITEGGRKGESLDFSKKGEFLEWEVPFDAPDDWNDAQVKALEAFHEARIAMQKQMDEAIAAHADQEILYDKPIINKNRLRISGPFTVEAVPFPSVKSLDEAEALDEADASIARTGESGRKHDWMAELAKTGIRGPSGQMINFTDLELIPYDKDMQNIHTIGHIENGDRVVVSFGPEHAALEQRQVANAMNEAGNLFPLPKMIVFCAFTFDPEAAKDIDAIKGITALKAQMNTDLLTEDLKKARSSNQSFWLMGQPDVEVHKLKDGKYQVEVLGFDYFDTVKGELISGGKSKIAMWSLDTDYDERSLFPHQVFFPIAGKGEGWEKLKKNIRAELDETQLDKFHGTKSLPFEAGDNKKIAVKIIDDRGIESLKVMNLD
ncbi:site-specific DNA-methyltransferase [Acinetobacter sp. VNH17]|uniref:site-specific DNA-methyltransferase (adenine-specific) n=1 Tax=Acinetobacter thutiue TaxID=2998078 RepID=A0ABT7WPJ3_9GAMM|nr:site-specific DNA-methyltransferase [Acinetobacter thutiue]MCY6412494.1 site-specific DNA-methyltransferase [Acinetobacter thutiue]MDN0014601.1 site-specific DNA-methyltransferase [Acinetobacter thutiue]